jgi:hypothetical protein
MSKRRTAWWVYPAAAVFVLTFFFNARQEIWGPANAGWTPVWPTVKVATVAPAGPMDKAGVRAGDVLEAAGGQALTAVPDWFVARAHFERERPIDVEARRNERSLHVYLVITDPAFRAWNRAQFDGVLALLLLRLLLLSLGILLALSRSGRQHSARIAALMLAVGAVAEGYPSAGWAAALGHLPAIIAIPVCLASVSCLLAPIIWLAFCASFTRFRLSQGWNRIVLLVPTVLFGLPMVASSIAMIYAPPLMARPWQTVLSVAPVRLILDTAGVTPLLFLNLSPLYRTIGHTWLLQLWLAVSVLYFAAGCLILLASYRRAGSMEERRRVGALFAVAVLFGLIILQNIFVRNWTGWFNNTPPKFFAPITFVAEAVFLVLVPLTLVYCVTKECAADQQAPQNAIRPPA